MTEIGNSAFKDCESLRSVRVPGGVSEIGSYAFQSCGLLESAVLEEGVETIGKFAFDSCPRLRTVVIPESVREIDEWAFDASCSEPFHIFYAGGREQWESIVIHSSNNLEAAALHYNCPNSGTLEPVTFDSRGGSPVEAQLCLPRELLEEPRAPKRENYTFTGWYRDSACADPWDFSRDRMDGQATLYAGWDPVPHTVRFSGSGSQTVYHGQRASPPAGPSRTGARFNGWYTDEVARTLYLFRSPVTENLTLYPGWLKERETPFSVTGWTAGAVALAGPAEKLGAVRRVWAASYDPAGKLADFAAGELSSASVTFPRRLSAGWRLYFLDAAGRPLAESVILE